MSEQERQLLVKGDLISMSKASKLTPYSAEYLSLLARKGRLPAVKLSRDWLTTSSAVLYYVKKQRQKHEHELARFNSIRSFQNKSKRT